MQCIGTFLQSRIRNTDRGCYYNIHPCSRGVFGSWRRPVTRERRICPVCTRYDALELFDVASTAKRHKIENVAQAWRQILTGHTRRTHSLIVPPPTSVSGREVSPVGDGLLFDANRRYSRSSKVNNRKERRMMAESVEDTSCSGDHPHSRTMTGHVHEA